MKKFNLTSFLVENKLTRLGRLSEGYMGTEYESSEDMAVDMAKKGIYEEESEVEEDYSKYASVEELMKEIETSTNEAAMKHKMERVMKACESLEAKATSLEEGEHASYIAPAKIKEMKRSAKELRKMHERLVKEYDKKYASKKKVESLELNEEMGESSLVKNLKDLTWEDISSAFVGVGDVQPGGLKVKKGVNFPLPDDSSTVVYTSSDFDAWKAKTMGMFGDVKVELNPSAKASFDQVKIDNSDFQSKRSAYIDSKAKFLSRDAEMGREID